MTIPISGGSCPPTTQPQSKESFTRAILDCVFILEIEYAYHDYRSWNTFWLLKEWHNNQVQN